MRSLVAERIWAPALTLLLLAHPALAARDPAPGFLEQSLDLPGMPAAVIPADMNGDGRDDLVVLVAYTAWGDVATTEQVEFDDIEGLVEVMNVVSALINRRELRVYPARSDGLGFADPLPALELDTSVHALGASAGEALLAITDDGIAAIRWKGDGDNAALHLEPLIEVETVLAGTGTFFSNFQFVHDLDGDGDGDLLLPIEHDSDEIEDSASSEDEEERNRQGWAVHRGAHGTFEETSSARLAVPPRPIEESEEDDHGEADEDRDHRAGPEADESEADTVDEPRKPRRPRQPTIRDVNGDGQLNLVVFKADHGRDPLVYLNRGGLSFGPAVEVSLDEPRKQEEIVYIGDLDGDGQSSVVAAEEREPGDEAGFKLEIEHAKEPDFVYRIYPLGADLAISDQVTHRFEAEGYTFEGDDEPDEEDIEIKLPGGFQDLDGDGRQDLVAITLDFSIVPLIFRALVLGSISLQMDFHPLCQNDDGGFDLVQGLDLSGKFKINIRNVQVKHLSQFEGDFNGDGRADFIQLGRGKKVTIHQGGPGCTYPIEPDRKIRLAKEPKHLGLVRILDLDANGLSDLYVVHPRKDPKSGETAPVRLDLYLGEH